MFLVEEGPRAQWSPIPKRKWKPIDDRKFGYDVSVRTPTRTDSVCRSKKTLIEVSCVRLSTHTHTHTLRLGAILTGEFMHENLFT